MYVVLDTNIWISEMGLNSGRGAATRFFILQNSATLAIPEVIRNETESHLRDNLGSYIQKISDNYSKLLSIFGKLKDVVLPDEDEIEAVVNDIFENLGVPIKEIPFTIESARSSYDKIINKIPPSANQKNQQFKDGVIWADCLGLLEESDVHLVTNDRAFFKQNDVKQGLAPELYEEIRNKSNQFYIHSELSSLLESIRLDIDIDPELLLGAFLNEYNNSVSRMLENVSFSLGNIAEFEIVPYATDKPNNLHVEFSLNITCDPIDGDGRRDGVIIFKGDADYNPQGCEFKNIRNFGEKFFCTSADGNELSKQNHTLYANSLTIGHKEVERSIKHPL